MGERQRFVGVRINHLGDLHKVHANEVLECQDGGQVVGWIFQEKKTDFGVYDKVRLEVGDNEGGKEVRVSERVVVGLA